MQKLSMLAALAILLIISNPTGAAETNDAIAPIAVLKVKEEPISGMALSNDGSRLLMAESMAFLWNVDTQKQICTLAPAEVPRGNSSVPALSRPLLETLEASNPTPKPKTYYPLLSQDGKIAVIGSLSSAGRLFAIQAWDAESGSPVGPPISTAPLGSFTAAALSMDGRLIAVAENSRALEVGEPVPLNPTDVGKISVWELKAGKLKWQLPAISYDGDAATSDDNVYSLCFSPDAMRLAVSCRSPAGCRLKILHLENTALAPKLQRPARMAGMPSHSGVIWQAGNRLLFREGLDFELWDSNELTREAEYTLISASRPNSAAAGFENSVSVLSSSGGRLALLRQRLEPDKKLRQLRIVVFDVAARKPIGFLFLPDEKYEPAKIIRAEPINGGVRVLASGDKVSSVQLALSGDGDRLAVSGEQGIVRVYDVAQLIQNAKRAGERRRAGAKTRGD